MAKAIVTVGDRFGRLQIVCEVEKIGAYRYFLCKCDCGTEKKVRLISLRIGQTKSCGCFRVDFSRQKATKHGESAQAANTSEYRIWKAMVQRCHGANSKAYPRYGGRGITVCDEWRKCYDNFLAYVGRKPKGCSLDRIDNSKGYEPGNVRWATAKQQARNTRRNVWVEYQGERLVVAEWAERLGIDPIKIAERLRRGVPVELALSKEDLRLRHRKRS